MTQAPCRPCKHPACPGLTRDRDGYCDRHKGYGQERKKAQRREKKTDPFYGTARWQRFRNWYKRRNPLCEHCLKQGRVTPTYCVDHIIEIKDGGELLNENNAQSLCRKCDAVKTAAEKRKRKGESNINPSGYISADGMPMAGGHHWNK